LTSLGNAWGSLSDYQKKKSLLIRALEINENYYGKTHPNTCATLVNLADVYYYYKNFDLDKDLLEHALEISKEFYGNDHLNIGIILANLGNARNRLGDHKCEKDLLLRAKSIFEKFYGPANVKVAQLLVKLGTVSRVLGDYRAGISYLLDALNIYSNLAEKKEEKLHEIYIELSKSYCVLGDYQNKNLYLSYPQQFSQFSTPNEFLVKENVNHGMSEENAPGSISIKEYSAEGVPKVQKSIKELDMKEDNKEDPEFEMTRCLLQPHYLIGVSNQVLHGNVAESCKHTLPWHEPIVKRDHGFENTGNPGLKALIH